MMMRQTWRWFGPADTVTIDEMLQAGVEGVVSALHHIKNGQVWSIEEIKKRQHQIATRQDGSPSGLTWEVVESVPVSEAIKTQTGDWLAHVEAYKQSLENLSACGIKIVCYNFMPVLDWTRTKLRAVQPHGGTAMQFDLIDFAIFDIHILKRPDAANDFVEDIIAAASARFAAMDSKATKDLQDNIIAGLPGANDSWGLDDVKALLETYHAIDAEKLRCNLIDFLKLVIPTCEAHDIKMCCHPDDPPFSLLGLPRIMSSFQDYKLVLDTVDSPSNGTTLCTGSLGVAEDFGFVDFIDQLGHRIHFVHLRNTLREGPVSGQKVSFFEAPHLGGDTDMVAVVRALLHELKKRASAGRQDSVIPMRPDHGQEILEDMKRGSMPGYPLIGRMRGLAELRGIMTALSSQQV